MQKRAEELPRGELQGVARQVPRLISHARVVRARPRQLHEPHAHHAGGQILGARRHAHDRLLREGLEAGALAVPQHVGGCHHVEVRLLPAGGVREGEVLGQPLEDQLRGRRAEAPGGAVAVHAIRDEGLDLVPEAGVAGRLPRQEDRQVPGHSGREAERGRREEERDLGDVDARPGAGQVHGRHVEPVNPAAGQVVKGAVDPRDEAQGQQRGSAVWKEQVARLLLHAVAEERLCEARLPPSLPRVDRRLPREEGACGTEQCAGEKKRARRNACKGQGKPLCSSTSSSSKEYFC